MRTHVALISLVTVVLLNTVVFVNCSTDSPTRAPIGQENSSSDSESCRYEGVGLPDEGEDSGEASRLEFIQRRVPAEWEPHAATWMQWPSSWEASMRPGFADIIDIIQDYEPVHLLTGSQPEKTAAEQFLSSKGVPSTNITWHIIPVDNAWMRDNGPVYVTGVSNAARANRFACIQNWKFDAWGGNFGGDVRCENDDMVPVRVAEYLGTTVVDHQDYVLERGNLEFNGAGTLALNWDCQIDRNPGMTEAEHEAILMEAFGLNQIIWAYGHDPGEGTTGHIDGTARFVDNNTIVIADFESAIDFELLATACQEAGLEVLRYGGDLNWLVGNGFVIASDDSPSPSQIASFFPGRDIHLIDVSIITIEGGGIHCVTNDQPRVGVNRMMR